MRTKKTRVYYESGHNSGMNEKETRLWVNYARDKREMTYAYGISATEHVMRRKDGENDAEKNYDIPRRLVNIRTYHFRRVVVGGLIPVPRLNVGSFDPRRGRLERESPDAPIPPALGAVASFAGGLGALAGLIAVLVATGRDAVAGRCACTFDVTAGFRPIDEVRTATRLGLAPARRVEPTVGA